MHIKNLHDLVTKINKVKLDIFPDIANNIFTFQENKKCSLRSGIHLASRE